MAGVAQLVLVLAKLAVVLIPPAVVFVFVRNWFLAAIGSAYLGGFAAALVAGFCALAVFLFCFGIVSQRE